mmetsp:Transcript_20861/g.53061  ORF Transcript_20861/g.53061 Transcript_20861/m.53061 type:complete len:213 (+) Transcript_20861:1729-2367(+)
MAPRCTGRCGALATRPPSGPNSAHEKSRRSLMFTLMEVRCSVRPICSAMPMKRWLKIARQMGSGPLAAGAPAATAAALVAVEGAGAGASPTSMRTLWPAVTCAVQPGSTMTVEMASMRMAGPGSAWPAARSDSRYTGVGTRPVSVKYADCVSQGGGSGPGAAPLPESPPDAAAMTRARDAAPVARTRASSTTTALSRVNPNSRWYACANAAA